MSVLTVDLSVGFLLVCSRIHADLTCPFPPLTWKWLSLVYLYWDFVGDKQTEERSGEFLGKAA